MESTRNGGLAMKKVIGRHLSVTMRCMRFGGSEATKELMPSTFTAPRRMVDTDRSYRMLAGAVFVISDGVWQVEMPVHARFKKIVFRLRKHAQQCGALSVWGGHGFDRQC